MALAVDRGSRHVQRTCGECFASPFRHLPSIRCGWAFEPYSDWAIVHQTHGHMRAKSSVRHWYTIPCDCGKKRLVELLRQRWPGRLGKRWAASFAAVSIQRKLGYHQYSSLNVLHVAIHLALRVLKNAQRHRLGRQIFDITDCISFPYSEQDQESPVDSTHDGVRHAYFRSCYPLYQGPHGHVPLAAACADSLGQTARYFPAG